MRTNVNAANARNFSFHFYEAISSSTSGFSLRFRRFSPFNDAADGQTKGSPSDKFALFDSSLNGSNLAFEFLSTWAALCRCQWQPRGSYADMTQNSDKSHFNSTKLNSLECRFQLARSLRCTHSLKWSLRPAMARAMRTQCSSAGSTFDSCKLDFHPNCMSLGVKATNISRIFRILLRIIYYAHKNYDLNPFYVDAADSSATVVVIDASAKIVIMQLLAFHTFPISL